MDNSNESGAKRNYKHIHMHDHDHEFVQFDIPASTVKDLALLEYMLTHDKQHAKELADIGIRLSDEGFSDAAEEVGEAVRFYRQAHVKLQAAVEIINNASV